MKYLILVSSALLACALGCETEPNLQAGSDDTKDGTWDDTAEEDTAGDVLSDVVADTVGQDTFDDVAVLDTQSDTSDTGTGGDDCEEFCEGIVAACPSGDTMATCMHSCESEAALAPDNDALDCAGAATDCDTANACWSHLFN